MRRLHPVHPASSDEDFEGPKCFKPFQLVLARKSKFQLWPAAIVGDATLVPGFKVYFFRSQDVMDLPRAHILMFFENLLERDVSFRLNNGWKKGVLKQFQMDDKAFIPEFCVETRKGLQHTVPFFDLFLTTKQADLVLPEVVSQTSIISW
ncbi:hypothetical protein HUJ04_008525 [Dendroctonus ponderosae]